jgi:hypothetical protein
MKVPVMRHNFKSGYKKKSPLVETGGLSHQVVHMRKLSLIMYV